MTRLVRFGDGAVGVLRGDTVHDVSCVVDQRWQGTPWAITDLIERWDEVAERVEVTADGAPGQAADAAGLLAPLPAPRHVFAAPLNYRPHVAEMVDSPHAPDGLQSHHSARSLGFFLKPPGSICGPDDAIELPDWPGRSFHHEIELGAVIGKPARAVPVERALEHVFGYVCLLDITLRTEGEHQEERVMRKSFATFTPVGPAIVTADEVGDVADLGLRLWVGDELRQDASTRDLIADVAQLVSDASRVLTLCAGDLYATGTPEGVGPIVVGDTVRASIDRVGELELPVVRRTW